MGAITPRHAEADPVRATGPARIKVMATPRLIIIRPPPWNHNGSERPAPLPGTHGPWTSGGTWKARHRINFRSAPG